MKSLVKLIQDVPASKKNKTPAKVLRRPIICICNDLYVLILLFQVLHMSMTLADCVCVT